MKPYHWTMLGLVFDIIGAFLVSVEAIKLENLRSLRSKVLAPVHAATLSPRIEFVEDRMVSAASRRFMLFYNGLHYLAGALLLVGVNYVSSGWLLNLARSIMNWLSGKPWYVIVLLSLVFLWFGIVAGLWMLGELIHIAITRLTRLSLTALDFIDARTPNGTIGIIGFALLFLGFLLQMLAAYLSGIRS
jgi:hypothetical protein